MMWLVLLVLIFDDVRVTIERNKSRKDLTKVTSELCNLHNFLFKRNKELLSEFIFTETEHGKALLGNLQEASDKMKEANEIK